MPTGPLYYKPLLDASARSATVGDATVDDVQAHQVNFSFLKQPDGEQAIQPVTATAQGIAESEARAGIEKTFTGIGDLLKARGGEFDGIKIAVDDAGWVANRTVTTIDKHPEAFDTTDLDQANRLGQSFAQQAAQELHDGVQARATNGTLDLGPGMARLLDKLWSAKEPMTPDDAALLGVNIGREIERTTTPAPADADLGPYAWIENATLETLAMWPGAPARVAKAMGVEVADAAAVDKLVAPSRERILADGPGKALAGVLALAGVDVNDPAQYDPAVQLLQGGQIDAVPKVLGSAIAANRQLAADKADWIATRIVDSGGNPRNIEGLAAQLREMTAHPEPAPEPAPAPPEPAPPEPAPAPEPPPPEA